MAAGGKNRVSQILVLLAFVSALAATYYLFFVPTATPFGGVDVRGDMPPRELVSYWDKFTFGGHAGLPLHFILFTAPVFLAGTGLFLLRISNRIPRIIGLWTVAGVVTLQVVLLFIDIGPFHLPTSVFLLAAAITESRKSAADAVHGSTGSPRTAV